MLGKDRMKNLRFVAAAACLVSGLVAVTAQTFPGTSDQSPQLEPRLHPTHPPEPILPVAPNVAAGESTLPINGTTWTPLGPAPILNGQRPGGGPVSGRLAGITADPNDANTVYVAAAGGGVWKTTDGGNNWSPLTDSQSTLSMGAIAIAPSNPSVIYAGTGEANFSGDSNFGGGVIVSMNGGATWTLQTNGGTFNRRAISEIAVDPTDANIVYVAVAGGGVNGVGGNNGVWRSANGGATWTNTTATIAGSTAQPWTSVRIDSNTPATLYAAVGSPGGNSLNGVYKTTNSGATWTQLTLAGVASGSALGRIVVAVSNSNSQVVYMSAQDPASSGLKEIERSDNGGTTWTDLTPGTPNYMKGQGWYDTTLIVDPTNSAVVYAAGAAGSNSILRSTNSGVVWTDISSAGGSGPHVDHHAAAFDANDNFLDGDDGGIYRYNTGTNTWTQLNGGATFLNTIQFQGIALHPTDPNIVLGGSQDNGTSRYSGTLGWTLVEGGDGGFVRFSRTNSSRVYHVAPVESFGSSAFFRRSDDGGTIWASKTTGFLNTNTFPFYPTFVVDPGNGDRVLIGADRVYETTNGADLWSPLSTPNSGGWTTSSSVGAIGLAPSDANTLYAATSDFHLFVTGTHGTTWTNRPLPTNGRIADIQVDPSNAQVAYAVISAFTSVPGGNVFKTANGGSTWTNVSGNLPTLPVWSLQIDATTPGRLFVGADDGVYVTTNDGGSWSRFGVALPRAQVFQIELNTGLGILGAATHGRGLWEIATSATPIVTTGSATGIGMTSATLSGTANPNGIPATAFFQYGPTPSYGSSSPIQVLWSGSVPVAIGGGNLTGLICNTLYHYRATATNASGTTNGLDATFTTAACANPPPKVTGDFDGDGQADIAIYRNTTGEWFVLRSSTETLWKVSWGAPSLGDLPVPGDFDGDGQADVAVYRQSTGQWFINYSGGGTAVVSWGAPTLGDVPVPRDYDGDGKTDIAVFRGFTGEWFILRSSDGGVTHLSWGASALGDIPVPRDYDGDGKADIAVYRGTTGEWFVLRSSTGTLWKVSWGAPSLGDLPVPADYDGDGQADVAVYRQSTGQWFISYSAGGTVAVSWGAPTLGDIPVPRDYDGDGRADIAVFRGSTAEWFVLRSSDGSLQHVSWGAPALKDLPLQY
jgi:photosystem II stability/assembly factor-like uncharacterized protein